MKKVATKWKERAKQDRDNREQIRQNQSLETAISYCVENFSAMEATKRIIDYIKNDRELTKKLCQYNVSNRSEQLVAFLKWVGDGYDFENNAERIVKEYIDETTNCA